MFSFLRPQYMNDPPAWFYPRILVGAGDMLSPSFCRAHNITHVINCAFPEDSPFWFRQNFPKKYVCIAAHDSANVNILSWYDQFESILTQFLREPGSGTVFVHCQCGINRSAFLTLTYVCRRFNFPYESTLLSTKSQRPCMYTNPVFTNQTREFINGRVPSEEDP